MRINTETKKFDLINLENETIGDRMGKLEQLKPWSEILCEAERHQLYRKYAHFIVRFDSWTEAEKKSVRNINLMTSGSKLDVPPHLLHFVKAVRNNIYSQLGQAVRAKESGDLSAQDYIDAADNFDASMRFNLLQGNIDYWQKQKDKPVTIE